MGTRADFYVQRGDKLTEADWLASIAFDGYPEGIHEGVLTAPDEKNFLSALRCFLSGRDDVTLPEQGWPWPWKDSGTTDFAYVLDPKAGKVAIYCFGSLVIEGEEEPGPQDSFPDMSKVQNVTLDGRRSGLLVL